MPLEKRKNHQTILFTLQVQSQKSHLGLTP